MEGVILSSILLVVYGMLAVSLAVFTGGIWVLLAIWLYKGRRPTPPPPTIDEWPHVVVQLPLYNEQSVVERLLAAVTALDYPQDRLTIQVLDDSTDDTQQLVSRLVWHYRTQGIDIHHIRRPNRRDYKAGALAYGQTLVDAPFIAVFDADFIPPVDFLRRTVPYFVADERLGILQARWSHLNAEQNLITRTQAMSIDGHFVIEQTARQRGGLLVSFNGTGGIWRRACIEDAGGWQGDTLTEDLDLSYRAQMRGWRFFYIPELAVPAEIPPQVLAFKRQQARWAKGTTQNLLKLFLPLWRNSQLGLLQKCMGTLHLFQYIPHLLLWLLVLLTPAMLVTGQLDKLPLAPLGVVGLGAPLMYAISQYRLYKGWARRLLVLPVLLAAGSGLVVNNGLAVLGALLGKDEEFKRTPKFNRQSWQQSRYALRPDKTLVLECAMLVYTLWGAGLALRLNPGIMPFLLMQAFGLAVVVGYGLMEAWALRQHSTSTTSPKTWRSHPRPGEKKP
ncbi:MAG: glycosyltransferase [Chloroflexi bacterium]|nr:MAG: glycosyltransferase [Chloroflexota bacterium]